MNLLNRKGLRHRKAPAAAWVNAVLLVMMFLAGGAGAIDAATFTVNELGDAGDGVCTDGTCTLRDAIGLANAAAGDDVIDFSVTGSIALVLGELVIEDNGKTTINGPGKDLLTVSGNNVSRVFFVDRFATAEIDGMTISNGNGFGAISPSFGAGIMIFEATLTLTNSTVSDNTAGSSGGGIFNDRSNLIVENSTISGNSALVGGGIDSSASVLPRPILTMTNSTVSGNSSTNAGGGISNRGGTAILTNSTVSGNTTGSYGGGINNRGISKFVLTNSTINGNSAGISGGGIYNDQDPAPPDPDNNATVTLNNTIVANNDTGGDCSNVVTNTVNASSSLIESGIDCVNGTNVNNLTGDPGLGLLQNNGGPTETHALLRGSIAINAGSNLLAVDPNGNPLLTDQRGNGFDRIVASNVDIGSFEVTDSDGDGVLDVEDICPGTVIPEIDNFDLMKRRYAVNAAGDFVNVNGESSGFTIADTGGCSATQIIQALGLGNGHSKFGIPHGILKSWINSLPVLFSNDT